MNGCAVATCAGIECDVLADGTQVVEQLERVGQLVVSAPPTATDPSCATSRTNTSESGASGAISQMISAACTSTPPGSIFCAQPGTQAVRYYDVIFLDIVMRYSSGDEVCAELRDKYGMTLPIIAATGNANAQEALHAAGFSSILEKPFTIPALRQQLEREGVLPRASIC